MKTPGASHLDAQVSYFEKTSYSERFDWQTNDPLVTSREKETLSPLVARLNEEIRVKGPLKVLESGCGEGVNLALLQQEPLLKEHIQFFGIDPCLPAVEFALQHGLGEIIQGDGLKLPWPDEYFDLTYCRDVLHHLESAEQQTAFVKEMLRVTKKSGSAFAIEPNANNPCILFQSIIIPEEKFVRQTTESYVERLLPNVHVIRKSPSALWRMLWNYRLSASLRRVVKWPVGLTLFVWEQVARLSPSFFWSYRIYRWDKP